MLAEETVCHLCGQPVDKSLGMLEGRHGPRCTGNGCSGCVPHPMRAEVDEIIPVSLGGNPYDRGNTRLSHRACNQAKGNRPHIPQPAVTVPQFPLTKEW
ncbi:MAG: HNH endonuclease [Micropruina sp.]